MLGVIKSSLSILFKWTLLLLLMIIIVRLVTLFVPSLSQDNLKSKLENLSSTSTSRGDGKPWYNFMGPTSSKVREPVKINPIINPTYDNSNGGTDFNYETYGEGIYGSSKADESWKVDTSIWDQNYDTENNSDTDWSAGQTDWGPMIPVIKY